ncbi:hypothetical protein Cantr_09712 [Candida viswanathii]|uniref:Uncharacterized protein n=1 Tax=Candida viswanathii TaxID=5486 RepID=A0A367YBA3_9ASCO|nr:hypothetical protein Cantr_09712 [Candida viswanathii]
MDVFASTHELAIQDFEFESIWAFNICKNQGCRVAGVSDHLAPLSRKNVFYDHVLGWIHRAILNDFDVS